MKRMLFVLAVVSATAPALAQTPSLESRIREQLRQSRAEVQDLQAQQARWQAEKAQLEKERDQARQEADATHSQPARVAPSAAQERALAEERHRREEAEATVARMRAEADAVARASQDAAAEKKRTAVALEAARAQVDVCTARNLQMYRVGQEVIAAYEQIGMGDVLAARQPFAARARARLDNAAQAFGDRLYEQRYDPRAGQAAATP
jgi:colicin import membrane protein